MALPIRPNYNQAIPNNPFYSPETYIVQGAYSPLIVGSGINVSENGVISVSGGGGGSGTVTSIITGTGLTGGPITTTGTISLANTAVTPGAYTYASITVDAQGRLTAASDGTAPVTSITAGTGLSGGTITSTGTIALANTSVTPGTYTYSTITVDAQGRLTAAFSGTPTNGTVTSLTAGTGLTGGTITTSGTIALDATCVISPTIFTGKGDILAASGAAAPVALSVGTNGQVLSADSSSPSGLSWVNPPVGTVTTVTGTGPISITGFPSSTPNVTIDAASTTSPGAVQLNDTTSSTSTTEALTANQGRVLQEQIDALVISNNLTFAGTLDAASGNLVTVTTEGASHGFAVGSPLPAPAAGNSEFFVIATVAGFYAPPPGGDSYQVDVGDWFLSNGTAWQFLDVGFAPPYASTTAPGVVQLATSADTQTGTDATLAVTPAGAASTYIPCAAFTSTGELLVGSGTGTYTALPVGSDGKALVANSTCTEGIEWATLPSGTVTSVATGTGLDGGPITSTGTISLADTAVAPGSYDYATITVDQQGRLTAASDGVTPVLPSDFLAKGDVLVGTATGTFAQLGTGTAGQILAVDSSTTTGLKWIDLGPTGVASVSGTSPITIDNTDPANPVVKIDAASTSAPGAVQLNDTVVSTSTTEAATANAVKTAYDLAADAVPCSAYTAVGDILIGTAAGNYSALPVGVNGRVLAANSGCSFGVEWIAACQGTVTNIITGTGLTGGPISSTGTIALADTAVSPGSYTYASITVDQQGRLTAASNGTAPVIPADFLAKGDLLAGTGAGTYSALSAGTNGQTLIVNTACASGLEWVSSVPGSVLSVSGTSPITVDNTDPANPVVEIDAASTTQSGAVQLYDGVDSTSDVLAATANAVKTAYDLANDAVPNASYTASGDLLVGSGAGTYTALASGPANSFLASDGAGTLQWITQSPGDVTTVSGNAPIVVDNTDPQNPVINVNGASTTSSGVVQLNDTVSSTSTSQAATARAVQEAYAAAVASVQSVTGTSPIQVDATNPQSPGISVDAASTTAPGVVQLNDTVASTSTTQAATANAVKQAYDAAIASVQSVTGTGPIQVDITDPQNPDISVDAASTTAAGVVQLNDTVASTSTTEAATANAVKTAYDAAIASVQSVTGTGPIQVDLTDPQNPDISVDAASTSASGVVQLLDSVVSTSVTEAATPNSVKSAYDMAVAAIPKSTVTAKGDLIAGTGSGTYAAFGLGTDGQVLAVDPTSSTGLKWQTLAVDGVQSVTGTGAISVNNTDAANPIVSVATATDSVLGVVFAGSNINITGGGEISVSDASTTAAGVVQLNDSVSSTLTTQAATANAVKTAYDAAVASVQSVTGTTPVQVDLTDPQNPDISVDAASTTAAGIVQLNDTVSSTSTTEAATANAVKQAYDTAVASVQSVTGTAPVQVDLTDPQNPDVSVDAASTTAAGVVQLNDTVTSTSTTEAATANAVKQAYDAAIASVQSVTGTGPIQVDLTDPQNPDVSVDAASTTAAGVVQLNDTTSSTSTTQAATANAVTTTYNLAAAAIPCSVVTAKGDIVAATASGSPTALPVGTNGQVLTVNTACSASLEWVTPTQGTVTCVQTGTGLSGGPITSTGTICLADTAVSPGAYTYASITVDQQGRLTAASNGTAPVTAVTGTGPISVTAGTTPDVSISCASTTALGAVQLTNALNSTSDTLALTACAGKCLQDQITALVTSPGIDFAGTLDANTGFVLSITSVGSAAGYTVGSVLPAANSTTVNTYVIVTTPGTFTPPGGSSTTAGDGDWFLASQTSPGVYSWQHLAVGFTPTYATTTASGVVCLSTDALACAGTDTTTAITPAAGAAAYLFKSCVTGKGALITGTAASTPTALTVGTDGQVLVACSAASSGLCWATPSICPATPTSFGTIKGTVNNTLLNTGLGCNALNLTVTGDANTAVGTNALAAATSGCRNTAVGACALCAVTTGIANIGIGTGAAFNATTAIDNIVIGIFAANCLTTGIQNVIIGNSGNSGSIIGPLTGSYNLSIGYGSGNITTGCCNVAIGTGVGVASGTGSCQLAIGFSGVAGCCWLLGNSTRAIKPMAGIIDCANSCGTAGQVLYSTGANSICWGPFAVPQLQPFVLGSTKGYLDASNNTGIGCGALSLAAPATSSGNVSMGSYSLTSLSSGCCNTAIGHLTIQDLTSGSFNTSLGAVAGQCTTGGCNTSIGARAGNKRKAGNNNVAVGFQADCVATAGSNNVAIGANVQVASATGDCQLAIGFSATDNWLTGTSSKAIRPGAGIIDCAGSCGTLNQVLLSNGANAICWGSAPQATPEIFGALKGCIFNTSSVALGCCAMRSLNIAGGFNGIGNTAIGGQALFSITTGCNNVGIGYNAMPNVTVACENISIGTNSSRTLTGSCNTVIGVRSGCSYVDVCANTVLGYLADSGRTAGDFNVTLGWSAGCSATGGSRNVTIGPEAQVASATGSCQLAIGFSSTANWLTGDSTRAIRPGAGIIDCAGSCGTSGQVLMSTGANAICWGVVSAPAATPTTLGSVIGLSSSTASGNVALGNFALCKWATASNTSGNVAIGQLAACNLVNGRTNVVIGASAMLAANSAECNTAVGSGTLQCMTNGFFNTALGYCATWCLTTGGGNTSVGYLATCGITTGCNNVAIGCLAGANITTGSCNVVIGPSAAVTTATGSCQLAIGWSSTCNWLTGTSSKAIRPGAGIIDCANSTGTINQVLVSTGSNSLMWRSVNSTIGAPNYGSYLSTVDQTATIPGLGQPVTIDYTVNQSGITLTGSNSFLISNSAPYNLQYSLQFETTTAALSTMEVWLVRNGIAVPMTNTRFTTKGANEAAVAALNYVMPFAAGDVIQLFWASDDTNMFLSASNSNFDGPAIPSAIITIVPVGA